jgi:excisionase family DNA binding protein
MKCMRSATTIDRPPMLLKVSDAGAMLGVGRSTVYDLIARGEIETVHIGRCCRIPVVAVEDYVRRLRDSAHQTRR